MNVPSELKPAFWGAAAGAVALAIVGFTWGGWVTEASADQRAKELAGIAVISALSPICVDKFQRDADASTRLVELKQTSSWQQASFVEKGGWATLPGSSTPDSAVARSCADMLIKLSF